MSPSAAAAGSNDTVVNFIAQKLVCSGKIKNKINSRLKIRRRLIEINYYEEMQHYNRPLRLWHTYFSWLRSKLTYKFCQSESIATTHQYANLYGELSVHVTRLLPLIEASYQYSIWRLWLPLDDQIEWEPRGNWFCISERHWLGPGSVPLQCQSYLTHRPVVTTCR